MIASTSQIYFVIIGALLTMITGGSLRFWQYSRDRWVARVEGYIDLIGDVTDLYISYCCEYNDKKLINTTHAREIALIGKQTLLDGVLETFRDRLSSDDQDIIDDLLNAVTNVLTDSVPLPLGSGNKMDQLLKERAMTVQGSASDLIIGLRASSDHALSFQGTFKFILFKSHKLWNDFRSHWTFVAIYMLLSVIFVSYILGVRPNDILNIQQ